MKEAVETWSEPESQDLAALGLAWQRWRLSEEIASGARGLGRGQGDGMAIAMHPRFLPSGPRFWKLEC